MSEVQLTPMMAQYRRIKASLPKDALLFYRLGDFYELFFEDAQEGAQLLNVALTQRQGIPMCGIPYHAANAYIGRILKAGRKVAICDQTEEARPGKLVQREVTAILSPGTHFDDRLLSAERNNFLAAVVGGGSHWGVAVVDLTTGEFRVTELDSGRNVLAELDRLRPAEVIFPANVTGIQELLSGCHAQLNGYEDWTFQAETAFFTLRDQFQVASLDGFGLKERPVAIAASGGVLHYLIHHLRRSVPHLTRIVYYEVGDFLVLDTVSLRNLEVIEPLASSSPKALTLYAALNRTVTPMGARKLRDWLTQPLGAVDAILSRQGAVAAWLAQPDALELFRGALAEVRDLERTVSRLSLGSGNARDMATLREALRRVPSIRTLVGTAAAASMASPLLSSLGDLLSPLPDLVETLDRALAEDPPLAVKEGGMIRDGYSPELDELRLASRGGKDWIARLQQEEIARTGIPSLKIGFNSVFGYFIEVTRSNLAKVPSDYIRKQTVANGERFITPQLKETEAKILGAEERGAKLEYQLFLELRERVMAELSAIQNTASALAQLDVLGAFAETARLHGWVRPEIGTEGRFDVRDGRHPAIERAQLEERFVPNDTLLDPGEQQIVLITGPNMAGKSTYIRQVALLCILAHVGSWVSASYARIDRVDRIFTRIGASDDLSRGQSTFMVEMTETAGILNLATRHSLVILDEIGRGTSTFDGLSLAWSIVEFLHHQVGAKTLFATHYHELTELATKLKRVRNFHVAVREWNDQIIFLRKVLPGGTDKSYGIQVARLAGVPREVIERAKEILRVLEEAELNVQQLMGNPAKDPEAPSTKRPRRERVPLQQLGPPPQLDLFLAPQIAPQESRSDG
jgi:DNA mismatch repair protein MutS